jgi:Methyltransferase domain
MIMYFNSSLLSAGVFTRPSTKESEPTGRVGRHHGVIGFVSPPAIQLDDDGLMETATALAEHWDQAYAHGDTTRSWFQPQAGWSLQMLDNAGIGPTDSVIDVGGGSSPLAAALLARGYSDITVLDVSRVGMRAAQQRLSADADRVAWLLGDVRTWRPARRYTVWHDRALFHFMTAEQDREAYLQTLERATSSERAVCIFATFAPDGPSRCSGLPVARYSAADIADAIGGSWQMIDESRESHTTPSDTIQPFTWTAFRRQEARDGGPLSD